MEISKHHIHLLMDVAEGMPNTIISFTANIEGIAYQCARLGRHWSVIARYHFRTMELISEGVVYLEMMNT